MEAAQFSEPVQARDDLLDVHIRRVMAQVHQALRLGPQLLRRQDARPPVGDHRRIEGRLVQLVLQQHAPVARQGGVDARGAVQIAIQRSAEILLAREVGAIADPHGDGLGSQHLTDPDALDVVLHGLRPDRGIGGRQAACAIGVGLAGLVLEGVGVHGVEAEPQSFRLLAKAGVVLDLVPGEVRRDPRGHPAQLLDQGAVLELLVDVGRLARDRELGEARAADAAAPRGKGDRETGDLRLDGLDIAASPRQRAAQAVVFIPQRA